MCLNILNGNVYATYAFLLKHEVPYKTIDKGVTRYRKKNNGSWENFKKKYVYILYKSIPLRTRLKYKLPSEDQLKNQTLLESIVNKETEKKAKANQKLQEIEIALNDACNNHYMKYVTKYHKAYNLNAEMVFSYSKLHAIINTIITLRDQNKKLKDLHKVYLQFDFSGISKTSNYKSFSRKITDCKKNGIKATILHGRQGNTYPYKLNDFVTGKIEQYLCDSRMFSYGQITEFVNNDIANYNKTSSGQVNPYEYISGESVSAYYRRPGVKNTIMLHRNKELFDKHVQPSSRRTAPLHVGDVWYMDGTKIQFVSKNTITNKLERLSIFPIQDVKSGKIVGFDLAQSEDKHNVLAAMEMSVKIAGLVPYEWVYDNASASKTEEFKSLKQRLELNGSRVRHAKVGNSQDKSQLERWFRTYQNKYQRLIPGFLGGGIKSKVDTERIDSGYLEKVRKTIGLPSTEQLQKTMVILISIFNATPGKSGKSPNQIFAECTKPNATELRPEQVAFLFWHNKTIKVRNMEIETEIRKQKYYYDLSYHEKRFELTGTKVKVYYDYRELSMIHVFDLNDKYIGEFKQKAAPHLSAANQTEKDISQIIKTSSHHKSIKTAANKRLKSVAVNASNEGGEDNFYHTINPLAAGKEIINNAESQVFIEIYSDMKNLDFNQVDDIPEVFQDNPLTNPDFGKPINEYDNLNTKAATLEVVEKSESNITS
ncbi:MAG: Mu transposase C-terminal domain-containing protein [Bacteroidota bacterium]